MHTDTAYITAQYIERFKVKANQLLDANFTTKPQNLITSTKSLLMQKRIAPNFL